MHDCIYSQLFQKQLVAAGWKHARTRYNGAHRDTLLSYKHSGCYARTLCKVETDEKPWRILERGLLHTFERDRAKELASQKFRRHASKQK